MRRTDQVITRSGIVLSAASAVFFGARAWWLGHAWTLASQAVALNVRLDNPGLLASGMERIAALQAEQELAQYLSVGVPVLCLLLTLGARWVTAPVREAHSDPV